MTFESRVARLEAIANELEGDIELSRALALFEEGIEHLRAAAAELSHAEIQVQQLIERSDGTFETESRD
jgi:exodeoxyribonuclease VII small subunit